MKAVGYLLKEDQMPFPSNKTKIVCTIGPASNSPEILKQMILAGMNIARLNFSHGEFSSHKEVIDNIRSAAEATGRRVAIMADLSGPKMRIGQLEPEPIELKSDDSFSLTTEDMVGNAERVSMSFPQLPQVTKPGDKLFLNDGFIQLEVVCVENTDVQCKVIVGGELRSRKGLNLPGIDLGIRAFTDRDHECLKFALENGVDAVSQSFVETAADIQAVREAASEMGQHPFIIAKIERFGALDHIDEILDAADGIMIARGDLGVEVPIERMAVIQKRLMEKANLKGKPVITATQMLESMTEHRLPTRAEATDVANAILDGTDCVMLSGESAMGKFPVESAAMLAKIAASIEPHRTAYPIEEVLRKLDRKHDFTLQELIALSVENTLRHVTPATIVVPTRDGKTARDIAGFRQPVWIAAVSLQERTCQNLLFSYGVLPLLAKKHLKDWKPYIKEWLDSYGVEGNLVILTEGPSRRYPDVNNRMEILKFNRT
jgi:pyruvate kinase